MNFETAEDERRVHGCCQKNRLSICLAISLTCVTLFAVFIVVLFVSFLGHMSTEKSEECATAPCTKFSAEITEFIDDSEEPCHDFYQFVCGKFKNIAVEKQINNPLTAEQERIRNILNSFITEPHSHEDPHVVHLQKSYFQSCLNVEKNDTGLDESFFSELDALGGWPFLSRREWVEEEFDWVRVMNQARQTGLPFEWFIKVDLYDDSQYKLQISNPINCGCNENDEIQRNILENLTKPTIETVTDLKNLRQFEQSLCRLCEETRNEDFVWRSAIDLHNVTWFEVSAYFVITSITGRSNLGRYNSKVAYKDEYIFKLDSLLKRTPKRVQANYILWKMIEYFAPYLSKPFRENYASYVKELTGEDVTRFQFCLEDTKSKFKFVSEIVYLQDQINSSRQEDGRKLVSSIKEELISHIENVRWKNDLYKEDHLDLYENLEEIIGGPDDMFDDGFISKYLYVGQLNFSSNNIIRMVMDWSNSTFNSKMEMIGRPSIVNLQSAYVANTKLGILLDQNEYQIILPAAVFHGLLYNSDLPKYYNYGGLGSTIGLDLVRNLHLSIKSSRELYEGFEENKKCIIDSLERDEVKLNSSRVFRKIYDDLIGQDLAYRAYQKSLEETQHDVTLVNLPYSPNQLFWIKSSMTWCYYALGRSENSLELQQIAQYKVNEAAKNSQFFASDFDCSPRTPMNPKNKCQFF